MKKPTKILVVVLLAVLVLTTIVTTVVLAVKKHNLDDFVRQNSEVSFLLEEGN